MKIGEMSRRTEPAMLEAHHRYVLEQLNQWRDYLSNLDDKIKFYRQSIAEEELS